MILVIQEAETLHQTDETQVVSDERAIANPPGIQVCQNQILFTHFEMSSQCVHTYKLLTTTPVPFMI